MQTYKKQILSIKIIVDHHNSHRGVRISVYRIQNMNTVSRFSYKERKVEDKSSKPEAMDIKVTASNNVERKIVPSAEVITRNSFKRGNPNHEEVQESTTNAKAATKLKSKQTKISSFIFKK